MVRAYLLEELSLSLLYLVAAVSVIPLTRALTAYLRSRTRDDDQKK